MTVDAVVAIASVAVAILAVLAVLTILAVAVVVTVLLLLHIDGIEHKVDLRQLVLSLEAVDEVEVGTRTVVGVF